MSAEPSLLELCRMQPRLAESTSAPISQKYSETTLSHTRLELRRACFHYFGEDRTIQFRLWERSGHLGIPDMTLIIIRISFRGAQKVIHAEMTA